MPVDSMNATNYPKALNDAQVSIEALEKEVQRLEANRDHLRKENETLKEDARRERERADQLKRNLHNADALNGKLMRERQ